MKADKNKRIEQFKNQIEKLLNYVELENHMGGGSEEIDSLIDESKKILENR